MRARCHIVYFFGFLALGALALASCTFIVDEEETDCGNGIVEGLEECDTANLGEDDCVTYGYLGGHLVCTPYCRVETFNCHDSVCGDGSCDDDESRDTCAVDCQDTPSCGDGKCDPSDTPGCQDCIDVDCGDGYCDRLSEETMCPDDCSSVLYCGDGICHYWEWAGCPDDCVEGNCDYDGVCEPDRQEPENQCEDCHGTPTCGNSICDTPGETDVNCPFDCALQSCGNEQVESGEQCDGEIGGRCEDYASRAGPNFEGGSLRCNADCFADTWECFPKDLGAACEGDSECQDGLGEEAFCHVGGGGQGICTLPCSVEGALCGPSGASCHDVSGSLDYLCLWPCSSTGEMRCDPRLVCLQIPMESANWYCVPSDQ